MLFNSYIFIFAFLPVTLIGFYAFRIWAPYAFAKGWLVGTSLFFYSFWNPAYLPLILGSIVFNYAISRGLAQPWLKVQRKALLVFGLIVNLGLLGYFKYADFFVQNLNAVAGANFNLIHVILPLGISFFTFQQIACLMDIYLGRDKAYNLLDYSLFVVFFPQLIAGPILYPQEMLPQFAKGARIRQDDVAVGLTLFLLGLFKKVLIADSVARYATPVFSAAANGADPSLFEAWGGALAYTLQLYFDFSGYSDMAIGLGRMLGVKIPMNFNSPYKALNISDFWRRWHITLSRWLREYIYIPLGGNRKGGARRYTNLMVTMLLGGLWHGAGWTFVFWGGLHGTYLIINHGWHTFGQRTGITQVFNNGWGRELSRGLTFLAVVVGWVFFRAESWDAATAVLRGMGGLNGVSLPDELHAPLGALGNALLSAGVTFSDLGSFDSKGLLWLLPLLLVIRFAPNPQGWLARHNPTLEPVANPARFQWQPKVGIGLTLGFLMFLVVKGYFYLAPSEFLYFNF